MGSKAGNIIKTVAPIAIGALTGNPWLGAAAGGIGGATQGQGFMPILTGALGGYGGASLGNAGANFLSSSGGIGGAFDKILSGAGNFFSDPLGSLSSGISNAGSRLSDMLSGGGSSAGGITWNPPGVPLAGAGAPAAGAGSLVGGGAVNAAATGGSSFGGGGLANALSGIGNLYTQGQAEDDLVKSQRASLDALSPFMQNGTGASNALADRLGTSGNTGAEGYGSLLENFNPGDLQNDPGYQFNLSQGSNALNNQLAASGMLGSGAALKAAQQFGQGLADTTYNNAFQRDLASKGQQYGALSGAAAPGLSAANSASNINTNIGLTQANADIAKGNTLTSTLSNLLSGSGSKQIIGYKPDGTPIYM